MCPHIQPFYPLILPTKFLAIQGKICVILPFDLPVDSLGEKTQINFHPSLIFKNEQATIAWQPVNGVAELSAKKG
ncbi:MAG: hypothetical protein WA997_06715 [Anaerolineales bacterium]|nr:hypothetical protein [Anaerolineales bacterium]